MTRLALDLRAALVIIVGFAIAMAVAAMLGGCGALEAHCDFEPVDITVPPAHTRSLRVAPCVHVTGVEASGVCGDFPVSCVNVEHGQRVRLWFPRAGRCGVDGEVYDANDPNAATFGLEYSAEVCP